MENGREGLVSSQVAVDKCTSTPTPNMSAPAANPAEQQDTRITNDMRAAEPMEKSSSEPTAHSKRYVDFVSGAVAGFSADAAMHPMDTIKARMQAYTAPSQDHMKATPAPTPHPHPHPQPVCATNLEGIRHHGDFYPGQRHGLAPGEHHSHLSKNLTHSEHLSMRAATLLALRSNVGVRSLYAGVGAVLLGSVPSHAIVFSTFQATKRWVDTMDPQTVGKNRVLVEVCCAAFSESCALITYVPSEVVAKRLQVANSKFHMYSSTIHAITTIVRVEGVRGLYTGLTSTAMRDIPFTAIQLPVFEFLKRYWGVSDDHGRSTGTSTQNAMLGFTAGTIAAAITTPFDMAKTRLQTQPSGADRIYTGSWDCLKKTFQARGIRGLFRGIGPRVLWVAPSSAITFAMYEFMVSRLSKPTAMV
mmetsp:Transcript_17469/g.30412  ORF Transcript_17469/g.30412 Transcript_17469/m.30412 type:complete len:416 (+) Transcript_17469:256-1503(+)